MLTRNIVHFLQILFKLSRNTKINFSLLYNETSISTIRQQRHLLKPDRSHWKQIPMVIHCTPLEWYLIEYKQVHHYQV